MATKSPPSSVAMRPIFFATLALSMREAFAASLRVVNVTTLGPDPQTVNRLNGESFQQDALVTFNGENTKHKDDDEEDLGGAPAFLCCTSTADSINIITQRYNSKHDCIFENNPGRMCVAPNGRNRTNEVAIYTRYHERCI